MLVRPKPGRAVLMHQDAVHRCAARAKGRFCMCTTDWAGDGVVLGLFRLTSSRLTKRAAPPANNRRTKPARLSPPSAAAGRPRYSLVWKLVMLPKPPPPPPAGAEPGAASSAVEADSAGAAGAAAASGSSVPGGPLCLSRPEWGEPVYFGSAARLQALVKATAGRRGGDEGGGRAHGGGGG